MSLKQHTPCDYEEHICPYSAINYGDCEYWCGSDPEPDDCYDYIDYDNIHLEGSENNDSN